MKIKVKLSEKINKEFRRSFGSVMLMSNKINKKKVINYINYQTIEVTKLLKYSHKQE